MQMTQPSPDALASFSDFVLERFGLVASMQVALVVSIAVHPPHPPPHPDAKIAARRMTIQSNLGMRVFIGPPRIIGR